MKNISFVEKSSSIEESGLQKEKNKYIYIYIYGIYKEYSGISVNIYDMKQSETQTHWGAADGGACISNYFLSQIFTDIPYTCLIYSIYIS